MTNMSVVRKNIIVLRESTVATLCQKRGLWHYQKNLQGLNPEVCNRASQPFGGKPLKNQKSRSGVMRFSSMGKAASASVLVLSLVLSGCGGGDGDSTPATPASTAGGGASSSAGSAASSAASSVTSSSASSVSSSSSSSAPSSSSSSSAIAWGVYSGQLVPDATGSATLADGSSTSFVVASNASNFVANGDGTVSLKSAVTAADKPVAKLLNVFDATGAYPKSATALVRVTPGSVPATNKALDIELALADAGVTGSRVKLIVSSSGTGVQLEKWDNTNSVSVKSSTTPSVDVSVVHTYQVTVTLTSATDGNIKVYVDGDSTAVLDVTGTLRTATANGDNYISFGDGGSNPYDSTIDWIVWTAGAYTPAQLAGKLPSSLGVTTGY